VVRNAAEYYRSMFSGRVLSWNLRDRHMVDTLDAVQGHLSRQLGDPAKIVVWEHNAHLGDARATEMGARGEWNVSQLVRERHGGDCRTSVSPPTPGPSPPTTGAGRRSATVRPALSGSVEYTFGQLEAGRAGMRGRRSNVVSRSRAPRCAFRL
jgi:erythromycin esterase-like protein